METRLYRGDEVGITTPRRELLFRMQEMESTSETPILNYPSGEHRHPWRMWIGIGVLVGAATIASWRWYGRTAWRNLRILYWQGQCSRFEPAAGSFAGTPSCWANYRTALPPSEPFMGGTQIFLHECVSPNGSQKLVALYMRPNVDHLQLCSIDGTVVVPCSFSRLPVASRNVVSWIRGWSSAVEWNHLRWAQLDPADHSHIIFKYDSPEPKGWDDGNADMDENVIVTTPARLDFWLQDNGQIVEHAPVSAQREITANSLPPVSK